jgi:predicted SnoaL-like aldol condensation-catalyzing enzyme
MRIASLLLFFLIINATLIHAQVDADLEENKKIAKRFYDDLWFTNNTDNYHLYVSDVYTVHDIGDRKGVVEPAIKQKKIADFFWSHGAIKPVYDFQIAEGDLVATRWIAFFEPETLFGKIFIGKEPVPIINVLRIKDGKIVEFWNHRHDIVTPQTLRFTAKGLVIGLIIALIPTIYAFRLRRKLKRIQAI